MGALPSGAAAGGEPTSGGAAAGGGGEGDVRGEEGAGATRKGDAEEDAELTRVLAASQLDQVTFRFLQDCSAEAGLWWIAAPRRSALPAAPQPNP